MLNQGKKMLNQPTQKKKKVKKKVSMINLGIIGKMCSFFFGSNEFELIDCVIKSG
jgi:hypothetical protein